MNALFLSEINKLKSVQQFLEKNDSLLQHLSKYGTDFDLGEFYVELERNRNDDIKKLIDEIKEIWASLRLKKNFLQNGDIDSLNLKSFKNEMIDLQEMILNCRISLKSNLELLKDQERDFSELIETYNEKIIEWEKPLKYSSSINFRIHSQISSTSHSDNKEVKEYMDFIKESNGMENGWSIEDHQLYLKLRNRHKNIENLANHINKLLPDISVENVKEHEIWYRKFLHLKTKKCEALERWRQTKKENIQKEQEPIKNNDIIKKYTNIRMPIEKNEEIQEKIALWKAEKEAKRQRDKAFEEIKNARMKEIQIQRRKLYEEVKKSVEKWKENKSMKEQSEKMQREMIAYQERKIRTAEANKMIKQFQSQDDIFIMRMKNIRKKEKNEIKRSKSSYIVNRDPDRIYKPTKQWILRTSKNNNDSNQKSQIFTPYIMEVPKLRLPDWRKNV